MIKICNGPSGWWFDGHRFSDTRDMATPVTDVDGLRRAIVRRAFYLNRWQGECGPYGPVSVGVHSLIVADFAYHLAIARDLSEETARLARRFGAIHDLGETLGMGDIAAPWLRSGSIPDAAATCVRHQQAIDLLFAPYPTLGFEAVHAASQIVKDADRAAAAIERRRFFRDDSKDCAHPDSDALFVELRQSGCNFPSPSLIGCPEVLTRHLYDEAMGHA